VEDQYGNTPLHVEVARWEQTAVVRLLVDCWPEGKEGQTSLSAFCHILGHYSASNVTTSVFSSLLEY
jgi:hypothetical protein